MVPFVAGAIVPAYNIEDLESSDLSDEVTSPQLSANILLLG